MVTAKIDNMRQILAIGETVAVEFKRAGNGSNPTLTEGDIFRDVLEMNLRVRNSDSNGSAVRDVSNVPINVPINNRVFEAIRRCPGINREQLAKELKVDVKTIGRAIAALLDLIEHKGSKKTGGYYVVSG